MFGMDEPQLAFDVMLHLGTLLSIVVFFRKDISRILRSDSKMLFLVALGSVPAFVIGFFFHDAFEKLFGMPAFVGYMLIATGVLLLSAHLSSKRIGSNRPIGYLTALVIGLFQAVAIVPGISRSGATIAGGMLCGADKESAFRFSFLLAIPAVSGASAFKIFKISEAAAGPQLLQYVAGGLVAAIVGLLTITALLGIVRKGSLYLFGIYCIAAGSFAIICLK
jgi:undecaprenyl-diphosphatase